jgi:hypothetical protein
MTTGSSISEQLRRQSVVPVESTIPPEMTIEHWRSRRRVPCHHLHDTATSYDRVAKLLSFLLVCTVCGTARDSRDAALRAVLHPTRYCGRCNDESL